MSATIPPAGNSPPITGLNLLSIGKVSFSGPDEQTLTHRTDAGGPQGVSQLQILADVMDKVSYGENGDHEAILKKPYEVFNMIGGAGTGG